MSSFYSSKVRRVAESISPPASKIFELRRIEGELRDLRRAARLNYPASTEYDTDLRHLRFALHKLEARVV